jgi:hypothetical protein
VTKAVVLRLVKTDVKPVPMAGALADAVVTGPVPETAVVEFRVGLLVDSGAVPGAVPLPAGPEVEFRTGGTYSVVDRLVKTDV